MSKEELKKNRGKDKGKGPQGGNSKGSQGKSFTREWSNKPPRMQRMAAYLQQQQQQSHQEVSDMNKLNNQNITMFPIRSKFLIFSSSKYLNFFFYVHLICC